MTDRERFKEALERVVENYNYIDREEFRGIFRSMVRSNDAFVRTKCEFLSMYVSEMFPDHLAKYCRETLANKEMGLKYESDGEVTFKEYAPEKLNIAKMQEGRLKKRGIDCQLIESDDKIILKWTEPKKID